MLYRKFGILILTAFVCLANINTAAAGDYMTTGQAYMFEGTISGLRLAYQTFDQGIKDPTYPKTRELRFLHSLTRTAMLFIRTDGGEIDSFLELGGRYDVELYGDSLDMSLLELYYPTNNRDAYQIPEGAPEADEVKELLNDWLVGEITEIINMLNLISNPAQNKFTIYFTPAQTGMESTLQVGYGEVLVLKGILIAIKSHLTAMPAYDLTVNNFDQIIKKFYADSFSVNEDMLDINPNLFKLLPTENDPTIGKDALAQAAADMIDAINYWLDAIEYIKAESAVPPATGVERFLSLDPGDFDTVDAVIANLTKLRNSVLNDTSAVYTLETAKTYNLYHPLFQSGQIVLNYDLFNAPVEGGSLVITTEMETSNWEITDAYNDYSDPLNLNLELERSPYYWEGAYMSIFFNSDKSEIIIANIFSWNPTMTFEDIHGSLAQVQPETIEFDPNPIYGSTPRYPDPISPRDMLPEFDKWNAPLPGTVGKGAGYDATLGGVLPNITQHDWQVMGSLQPAGVVAIPELYPYQYGMYYANGMYYGMIGFWFDDQIIFEDIADDVDCDSTGNLDIDRLYMGYYVNSLFGEITFNDKAPWSGRRVYEILLSYSPPSENLDGALELIIEVDETGNPMAQMYEYRSDYYGYGYLNPLPVMISAYTTQAGIQFKIDLMMGSLPFLPGRFVSIISGDNTDWMYKEADENLTHIQIGPFGSVSGNVTFDGEQGQTIFVQAYTDPQAPDESIVSSCTATSSGDFILEGIGLGWQGYIRALTPVFGFENPFELRCLALHDTVKIRQWKPELTGVNLDIKQPLNIEINDTMIGYVPFDDYSQHIFSFDAIEGAAYNMFFDGYNLFDCRTVLYGRDGDSNLIDWNSMGSNWQWQCPQSGKYFIDILRRQDSTITEPGNYTFILSSEVIHYTADVAGPQGIGLKDGVVDYYDLNAICASWLLNVDVVDINKNSVVDCADFAILASQWLSDQPVPVMMWIEVEDVGVPGYEGFHGLMSKYETTNSQYCKFLNAALASGDIIVDGAIVRGAPGSNPGEDFPGLPYYNLNGAGTNFNGAVNGGAARINFDGTSFSVDRGFEQHPVTYVSWYGATAFCGYYGWRLPTEWEWQAVADYDGSYVYGCGVAISNSIANYYGSEHPHGTSPVGAFGAYGYGIADMAGNVAEFTSSISGSSPINRGGAWNYMENFCDVSSQQIATPQSMQPYLGFRACSNL